MADLGLSRTLQAFRSPIEDGGSAEQLHRALTERVGSLGWVLEGVIQSVGIGDLDTASRLWGDEAIDLLWERGLLSSPDGNPNHREVRLADDAGAWASARRAELLMTPKAPRHALLHLDNIAVTTPPVERHGVRPRVDASSVVASR